MKTLRIPSIVVLFVLAGPAFNANAQTLTALWSFTNGLDGATPEAGLVQGSDGSFYGASFLGTLFRISSSGNFTNLYAIHQPVSDGVLPGGGLVQGRDGNFYGTTYLGGANSNGSIFRISSNGSFSNLYSFSGPDGADPQGGLVQGTDGNFYGTTYYGGASANCMGGCGSVFKISPGGSFTNLYSFDSSQAGYFPAAGLVQGNDGNFYGTTYLGGINNNWGSAFRISPSGSFTNLYTFKGLGDGANPAAALVLGSDGNFYGTTRSGDTVFRISPAGSFTNLHTFSGSDGSSPNGLVQGSDGSFYGTAENGGTSGSGTVFRISPSGSFTNLYFFGGGNGAGPFGGLVQGSDGNFYGTTAGGGTSTNCPGGCGTVFKFSVPLSPPPNQISGIKLSGTNIVFSIPSVAHETYQLQFSSSMRPTNWINIAHASVTNSIGALLTVTNFGGAIGPQGFYRFDITP